MADKNYFLSEFLVLRDTNNQFRLLDIHGGEFITNYSALMLLLNSHRANSLDEISARARKHITCSDTDIESTVKSFVDVGLLKKLDLTDTSQWRDIANPMNTEQVINNVNHSNMTALNMKGITISPGLACSYNCKACYAHAGNSPAMGDGLICKILQDSKKLGATMSVIGGGEPTHPSLIEKAKYAVKKSADLHFENIALLTSGYELSANLPTLRRLGLTDVEISLDSLTDYHNKYRGHPEALSRALKAVDSCKNTNTYFCINTVLNSENFDEMEDLVKFCISEGGRGISFLNVIPSGRIKPDLLLSPTSIREIKKKGQTLYDKYGQKLALRVAVTPSEAKGALFCRAGITIAYATEKGELCPCNNLIDSPFGLENLADTWSSASSLQQTRLKKPMNETCKNCEDLNDCFGKCRALAKAYTGDIYASKLETCPWKAMR